MRWLRQLACRAFWTAIDGRPGPVHLNFSLREPLVLDAPLPEEEPGGGGRAGGRPWVTRPRTRPPPRRRCSTGCAPRSTTHPRGVIVAGRSERDPGLGEALAALADALALPLLADPLSGARRGPAAIAHYDALLRDPDWAAPRARPGDPRRRPPDLEAAAPVAARARRRAARSPSTPRTRGRTRPARWRRSSAPTRACWRRTRRARSAGGWRSGAAPTGAAGEAIAASRSPSLSEPRMAAELGVRLAARRGTLVVASSMPVRDVETFFPARDAPPRVLSNRGANGIDGTVSTAFGVAAAGHRTVLLTGDVALAHDIGGLLAARRLELDLTIVLINNDGGGIFHFLPVGREGADFERHVATPHGLDFAHAAALYGLAPRARRHPAVVPRRARRRARGGRDDHRGAHRSRGERRAPPRVWQAVLQSVRGGT